MRQLGTRVGAERGATVASKEIQLTWRMTVFVICSMCAIFAFASGASAMTETAATAPSIVSDKADYSPGEIVVLTGANWGADESVHIFVNDDSAQTWSYNGDVTADSGGNFTSQVQLPTSFVSNYAVVATGATSGTARTTFTDASLSVAAAPSGVSFSLTFQGFTNSTCTTAASGSNGNPQAVTVTAGTAAGISFGSAPFEKLSAGSASAPGGATFLSWSGPSSFSSTSASICIPTPGASTDATYTATYQTAIANANTSTVITSSANPSTYPAAVTFTATVTSSPTNPSSGSVTFKDGGSTLCGGAVTLSGNTATCTP